MNACRTTLRRYNLTLSVPYSKGLHRRLSQISSKQNFTLPLPEAMQQILTTQGLIPQKAAI